MEQMKYYIKINSRIIIKMLMLISIVMIFNLILNINRVDNIEIYYLYSHRKEFIFTFIIPIMMSIYISINTYIKRDYVHIRLKERDRLTVLNIKIVVCFNISTILLILTFATALIYKIKISSITLFINLVINNTLSLFLIMMVYDFFCFFIKKQNYSSLIFILSLIVIEIFSTYIFEGYTVLEILFIGYLKVEYKLVISMVAILLYRVICLKEKFKIKKNNYTIDKIDKKKFIVASILMGVLYYFMNIESIELILGKKYIFTPFVYLEFGDLENQLIQLIQWMLPLIICILKLHDYISDDIVNKSSLILPRIKNINIYILLKSIKLYIYVFIYILIIFFVIDALNKEGNIDIYNLKFMMLIVLYFYTIMLHINIINMFLKSNYSVLLILISVVLSLMSLNIFIKLDLDTTIFKFMPYTSIYIKHLYNDMFSNLGYKVATIILTVSNILILIFSSLFIKRIDRRNIE